MTVTQPSIQIANPKTSQDLLLDAMIRHQIGLMRVAGSIRNASWGLLDATEGDMRRLIADVLERSTNSSVAARRRVDSLIDRVAGMRSDAWDAVRSLWRLEFAAIAIAEPETLTRILRTVLPVEIEPRMPARAALRAVALERRYGGAGSLLTLQGHWAGARAADLRRIESQIRRGVQLRERPQEVARRVVGRITARGRDGVTERARQNVRGIVRTSVNHNGNGARSAYWAENPEIVIQEIFVAVLDGNTTPICRETDAEGRLYEVGEGPIPPLHTGCRSMRNAVLNGEVLGERAVIPATNRTLLREFSEARGISPPATSRASLPRGTKGEYDAFKARRIREMIGVRPRKVTFESWLRDESRAFQDDYLGPTRAKLFRDGGLRLKQFNNPAGREMPLRDLARMHGDAFEAAGLDPREFR